MIQAQRLSRALASGLSIEVLQKIIPFLMISIARTRLGLENFGYAIFSLSVIESLIPWVVAGYNHAASVHINQSSTQGQTIGQTVVHIQCLKALHAIALLIGLGIFSQTPWAQGYHPTLFLLIATCLISITLESNWLLIATQKVAWAHTLNGCCRLFCLILAFFLIQGPDDTHLLIFLWIAPSIMIHLATAGWAFFSYGIHKPSLQKLPALFREATPYFWLIPLTTLLERMDVLFVEPLLGAELSGIYGGPGRLTHSLLQTLASVGNAFFSEMLQVQSKEYLSKHLSLSLWLIALISCPILVGTPFVAQPLLDITLGETHPLAGSLFCLFNLGLIPSILIHVFGFQILITRGQPQTFTRGLAWGCVSFFVSLGLCYGNHSVYTIFSCALIAKITSAGYLFWRSQMHTEGNIAYDAWRTVPGALLMGGYLFAVQDALPWWGLIVTAAGLYGCFQTWMFQDLIKKFLKPI